jgi:hypothetical protein
MRVQLLFPWVDAVSGIAEGASVKCGQHDVINLETGMKFHVAPPTTTLNSSLNVAEHARMAGYSLLAGSSATMPFYRCELGLAAPRRRGVLPG